MSSRTKSVGLCSFLQAGVSDKDLNHGGPQRGGGERCQGPPEGQRAEGSPAGVHRGRGEEASKGELQLVCPYLFGSCLAVNVVKEILIKINLVTSSLPDTFRCPNHPAGSPAARRLHGVAQPGLRRAGRVRGVRLPQRQDLPGPGRDQLHLPGHEQHLPLELTWEQCCWRRTSLTSASGADLGAVLLTEDVSNICLWSGGAGESSVGTKSSAARRRWSSNSKTCRSEEPECSACGER